MKKFEIIEKIMDSSDDVVGAYFILVLQEFLINEHGMVRGHIDHLLVSRKDFNEFKIGDVVNIDYNFTLNTSKSNEKVCNSKMIQMICTKRTLEDYGTSQEYHVNLCFYGPMKSSIHVNKEQYELLIPSRVYDLVLDITFDGGDKEYYRELDTLIRRQIMNNMEDKFNNFFNA